MNKAEAKTKRQELLDKIYELEKKRCKNCNTSTLNKAMVHCECSAAVKIRKLGAEYQAIATKAREGRLQAAIDAVKARGLTIEIYKTLKEMGMVDKDIYKTLGIRQQVLIDWKYDNGLTKNPRRVSESKGLKKNA